MSGSGCRSGMMNLLSGDKSLVIRTPPSFLLATTMPCAHSDFSRWRPDAAVDHVLDLLVYCVAFSQGYQSKLGGVWCEVFGNRDDVFMIGKRAKTLVEK